MCQKKPFLSKHFFFCSATDRLLIVAHKYADPNYVQPEDAKVTSGSLPSQLSSTLGSKFQIFVSILRFGARLSVCSLASSFPPSNHVFDSGYACAGHV